MQITNGHCPFCGANTKIQNGQCANCLHSISSLFVTAPSYLSSSVVILSIMLILPNSYILSIFTIPIVFLLLLFFFKHIFIRPLAINFKPAKVFSLLLLQTTIVLSIFLLILLNGNGINHWLIIFPIWLTPLLLILTRDRILKKYGIVYSSKKNAQRLIKIDRIATKIESASKQCSITKCIINKLEKDFGVLKGKNEKLRYFLLINVARKDISMEKLPIYLTDCCQ